MREYAEPRLERQRVMRRIVRLCTTQARSNDELAKKIGTTRGSVQVLTHRMRRYGQIETLNPGTHQAVHVAVVTA